MIYFFLQVDLSQQDKDEIVEEVESLQLLGPTIEIVHIVLGFLTFTSWSQNACLSRYVREVLKLENAFKDTPKVDF